MGVSSWIVIGLVTGLLARWLLPGQPQAGYRTPLLLGVTGALLGGFLATLLGFGGIAGFDPRSLVTATLGAIILLLLARLRGR